MGAATLMSRVLGLVREQVFAALFGASHATDAFNIAFRIPNLLRDLFAEGAMSAALVPTFVAERKNGGDSAAWLLAGIVFRSMFVITLGIAVVGMIFAPQMVSLYAKSFQNIPGKFELTVSLTRWLYPFFPLVVLAAAFMAVLNAVGKFFVPAFASAVFNMVSIGVGIVGVWVIRRTGGEPIVGMAVGVIVGGVAQAFCQFPVLRKAGFSAKEFFFRRPLLPLRHPGLRRVMLLMIPGTLGLAATQINILVNSVLATGEGPGAVSWLNYAFRLMQFPIGVFGVSFAAATLPALSGLWVEKKWPDVSARLSRSMIQTFAINLPAAAGLFAVGPALIEVLFERGAFTAQDTRSTAMALSAYALGLAFYSGVKVLVPAFYAFGDTRVPVLSSVVSVVGNLVLNLLLVGPYGFWGLALGTSATAFLNWGLLMIFADRILRKKGSSLPWGELIRKLSLQVLMSVMMGRLVMWASEALVQKGVSALGVLLCMVPFGVILTVVFSVALGIDETTHMLEVLKKRLMTKRRFRK